MLLLPGETAQVVENVADNIVADGGMLLKSNRKRGSLSLKCIGKGSTFPVGDAPELIEVLATGTRLTVVQAQTRPQSRGTQNRIERIRGFTSELSVPLQSYGSKTFMLNIVKKTAVKKRIHL